MQAKVGSRHNIGARISTPKAAYITIAPDTTIRMRAGFSAKTQLVSIQTT